MPRHSLPKSVEGADGITPLAQRGRVEDRAGHAHGVAVGLHGVLDVLAVATAERDGRRNAGIAARSQDELIALT